VAAAAVLLFVVTGAFVPYFLSRPVTPPGPGPQPPPAETPKKAAAAQVDSPPLPRPSWPPRGYQAVDWSQTVPDRPDLPMQLKRKDDEVVFKHFRDEVYLPVGYVPESEEYASGAEPWPKVIVREQDKVRFIRIRGGTYKRGDPREPVETADLDGRPMKSHWVKVPGFYIQETEVTNDEIEFYERGHPEADEDLQRWKEFCRFLNENSIDKAKIKLYPAVCIGYALARKYARSVKGLLPTEAEWEWAAKSCQETYWFAWGAKFGDVAQPPLRAKLEYPTDIQPAFSPVKVKSSPDDQTEQQVYDLVGNVREICADVAKDYSGLRLEKNAPEHPLVDERPFVDLTGVEPGGGKVKVIVRGGSYATSERKAMAFYRSRQGADDMSSDVGFRVVIECPSRTEEAR
jgi:serine/threonine-protein kinase